jgi:hypothetical protein
LFFDLRLRIRAGQRDFEAVDQRLGARCTDNYQKKGEEVGRLRTLFPGIAVRKRPVCPPRWAIIRRNDSAVAGVFARQTVTRCALRRQVLYRCALERRLLSPDLPCAHCQ